MPDAARKFLDKNKDWEKITKSGFKLIEAKEHIERLLAENAELKKFLKHARDDKEIRLGEIEELEGTIVGRGELIAHLERQCDRLRKKVQSLEEDLYFTVHPEEHDELPPKAIEEAAKEEFNTNQVESGDEAAHRFAKLLVESEKREADLREALELFRSCMGDGGDLEHAAELLRVATNDHGVNQTYDNNPYAMSEQLEAMATFLHSEETPIENPTT